MSVSAEKKIALIKSHLIDGSREEQLAALCAITPELIGELLDPVIALTNHWRPELRIAALHALLPVETDRLTEVIRHSLRDHNRDVRSAAAELFHREEKKLAA